MRASNTQIDLVIIEAHTRPGYQEHLLLSSTKKVHYNIGGQSETGTPGIPNHVIERQILLFQWANLPEFWKKTANIWEGDKQNSKISTTRKKHFFSLYKILVYLLNRLNLLKQFTNFWTCYLSWKSIITVHSVI